MTPRNAQPRLIAAVATAVVSGAACALALGGCGGASTAGSVVLDANSSVQAAAANPVTVSPLPGTIDASPTSQISFLGGPGTQVTAVRVVGSHSGLHAGVLRAYSTGTGESFLPSRPFVPGERVAVSARIAGQTHPASTTFTVAHPVPVSQKQFPIDPGSAAAVQHYSSAPSLTPSTLTITTAAKPGASPGDLFLAPYQADGTAGPMIAEQSGRLVWFHPLPSWETATNFSVQQYEGKPALVWWQGRVLEVGFGQGEDEVYNTSYQHIATIRAGNGYRADLHEIQLEPQGVAWLDAFYPIAMNLAALGGRSDGVVSDSIVEEIDVKTGLVMWEWHALGHIPVSESHNAVPKASYPWDYVHVNSVDPGPAGEVLLSARNTWGLYDVNIHSGGVLWRLGGAHSSFKLGPGASFYWQHNAEFQSGGLISMFDNGSDPPKEKQSRGLLLAPNFQAHTVSLVKQFVNPSRTLLASSQGNTLSLAGGNWLLGYGGLPNFTEFSGSGHVLLDGTLGPGVQSFRTYLSPWSATAPGEPSAVAATAAGGLSVSVSWNGATEVASWRVLAGASPAALAAAATAARSGFQTTIAVPAAGPYVAVQALSSSGAIIGVSSTVKA